MSIKIHIQSPCASGNIDGPVDTMFRQLHPDNKATSLEFADVVIVPITYFDWFKFDDAAMDRVRGKKWVLCDYSEFGWDWDQESSYLWGTGERKHLEQFCISENYSKFDQFVRDNPPILTFQRELLEKDRTGNLLPIEYLAHLPEFGADFKEDYMKRPLEVANSWGRSSESRMYLHGAFFSDAPRLGYDVISEWSHLDKAIKDNPGSRKWMSVHVPHYARIDVKEVQQYMMRSKIVTVLGGAGFKTFRTGEVCGDALMAMPYNKLAWSYPWDAGNSILLPQIHTSEDASLALTIIADALMQPDLYETYRAAMENARNYRPENYLRRWVVGNIEKHL